MKIVDANVLVYAVNEADPKQREAARWLDGALSGEETIGFAWIVIAAFLRLTTRAGLFPRPLRIEDALDVVRTWLDIPSVVIVEPTTRHFGILAGLLTESGSGGNLVSDAHLAAMAIEHNAVIVSFDADFQRFRGVKAIQPDPISP